MQPITRIRNFTGHTINIPSLGVNLEVEGAVKTHQVQELVYNINGLPVYDLKYLEVTGLPEAEDGTLFVVSAISLNGIREMYPERTDCCSVHKVIKDANGRTIGCAALRLKG